MKKINYILIAVCISISACTDKTLDAAKAAELIKQSHYYPRVLNDYIFCGDPVHAKRMLDAGFEEKGYVSILKVKTYRDIDKPWIVFKDASKPYLLSTSKEDRKFKIQKVKTGTEEFDRIVDVKISSDGKKAIATYRTIRHNNIFASLRNKPRVKKQEDKAYFLLNDKGWELVNVQDFEMLELKNFITK